MEEQTSYKIVGQFFSLFIFSGFRENSTMPTTNVILFISDHFQIHFRHAPGLSSLCCQSKWQTLWQRPERKRLLFNNVIDNLNMCKEPFTDSAI